MKPSVLLFFLLFAKVLCAQELGYRPYYDYTKCMYGLEDTSGHVLIEPQYNSLRIIKLSNDGPLQFAWQIGIGKHSGLLKINGDPLLPVEYTRINLVRANVLSLFIDQAPWIYDVEKDTLIRGTYARFSFHGEKYYYEPHENGKIGLMSADFETILPAKYDQISCINLGAESEESMLFQVRNDGLMGIVDFKGNIVVPLEFLYVGLHAMNTVCENITYTYFPVTKAKGEIGAFDLQGNQMFPPEFERIMLIVDPDANCEEISQLRVLLNKNEHQQVLDLRSGKSSDWYDHLAPVFGGYYLFHDRGTCGLLNADFDTIQSYESGVVSSRDLLRDYDGDVLGIDGDMARWYHEQNSIRYYYHLLPPRKLPKKNRDKVEFKRAMVHIGTGKHSDYHSLINAVQYKEQLYFRGVDYDKGVKREDLLSNKQDHVVRLTYYDSLFNPIHSYEVLRGMHMNIIHPKFTYHVDDEKAYWMETTEHRIGALNYKGDIVIPFTYEVMSRMSLTREADRRMEELYFLMERQNKIHVYDDHGVRKLPFEFDSIKRYNDYFMQAFRGDSIYIYDINLDLMRTMVIPPKGIPQTVVVSPEPEEAEVEEVAPYVVKDGYLYVRSEDTLESYASYFRQNYFVNSVDNYFLVDSNARVIWEGSHHLIAAKNGYFIELPKKLQFYSSTNELMDQWKAGIKVVRVQANQQAILHLNGKSAVYDTRTANMLIPFEYRSIELALQFTDSGSIHLGYWCTDNSVRSYRVTAIEPEDKPWYLYNLEGKQIYPFGFDQRANSFSHGISYISSQGKFGLLGDGLKLLTDPVYDHFIRHDSAYYLMKDRKWYVQVRDKQSIAYEGLCSQRFPGGFVVQQGDQLGILDNQLNVVVPLSNRSEFFGYDAVSILAIAPRTVHGLFDLYHDSLNTRMKELLLKNAFWRYASESSTSGLFFQEHDFEHRKDARNKPFFQRYNHGSLTMKSTILYADEMYATERVNRVRLFQFSEEKKTSGWALYYSYKLNGDTLQPLTLRDITLPGMHDALDSLIIKEVNRTQAFGNACVDLLGEINEMKQRFSFTQTGIELHFLNQYKDPIFLPYTLLDGVIEPYRKD